MTHLITTNEKNIVCCHKIFLRVDAVFFFLSTAIIYHFTTNHGQNQHIKEFGLFYSIINRKEADWT